MKFKRSPRSGTQGHPVSRRCPVPEDDWARNEAINMVMQAYSMDRASAAPMVDAVIAAIFAGTASVVSADAHTIYLTVTETAHGRGESWAITALPKLIAHHPNTGS
ncbi:hypothetical protein ACIQNU_04260 [Streptomyces sp. NPDC091292]|uniref:hypothetical protein n=1 Tax=Streptomyces sp. NPDC091292 TaxID=3365991 RepID=UPI0037FB7819